GSGASYDLTVNVSFPPGFGYPTAGGIGMTALEFVGPIAFEGLNDQSVTLYLQSVRMTGWRLYKIEDNVAGPPPPTTGGPGGNALDAATPSYREVDGALDFWDALTTVALGQRVNLTAESEWVRLGAHARGYLINRLEMDLHAELQQGVKVEILNF